MALRGPAPRVFTLSLRSQPERGGPVRDAVDDRDGLERDPTWRHVLVLVHGFNNTESDANAAYDGYVDLLRPRLEQSRVAPDAVAKLHWPGNEAIGPLSACDVAGYPVDVERALQAVHPLAVFLWRLVSASAGRRRISLVGHSLGCRLITEAMCRLGRTTPYGPPLGVVMLMAAAVPVELAKAVAPLSLAASRTGKLLKAYSTTDWVLLLAFPAGQSLACAAGYEREAYVEAIGRHGDPSGFGELFCRSGNGHSDYWTDEYAAAILLFTIDATLRPLPPPVPLRPHDLAPAAPIAGRKLARRDLPE